MRSLRAKLTLGEQLGLIKVGTATEPMGDLRAPNMYRLTYLPAKGSVKPTDEWTRVTEEGAQKLVAAFNKKNAPKVTSSRKRRAA